jgi:hypothetical protein
MAARLPLPKHDALPSTVIFHRDHPRDERIVLQIPNEARTDSQTYVLRTDRTEDMDWIEKLIGASALRDKLTMEKHVAYDTKSGFTQAIDDLDQPTWIEQNLRAARAQAQSTPFMQRLHTAARGRDLPVPPLRRFILGSRLGGRNR